MNSEFSDESEKIAVSALDKALENLYNTWAFTNEELDDIRYEMAAYATSAVHDTKIANESIDVLTEYKDR